MASLLGSAGGGREYVLKIVADVKDAIKGVDDVQTKTSSMKDKMVGIGKGVIAGLGTAAVLKFGSDTINAAADADDAMDQVSSAFGTASKSIVDFSKTADEKMGLSAQDYQTMAAKTGQILTGFGISNDDAAKATETLSQRAADMAAIWGTDTPTAMDAFDKAMQGQTKGLKQFGISLSKNEVDARAMAKGYVDSSGKVTDAGRAIATQELILEKTGKYQGEFAKNSGDLGSQQDILKAKFENLQTSIGTMLLPTFLKLFDVIKPLIDFVTANSGWLIPLMAGILGVVGAVKAWTIAQAAFNLVMDANPIFLVVAAIAALTAGIIWAYQNVEWFRNAVDAMGRAVVAAFNWVKDTAVTVFNWIRDNWPLLLAIITGPFGLAVYAIQRNWDTIKNAAKAVIDAIGGFFQALPGRIGGYLSNIANIVKYPFEQAWNAIQSIGKWIGDVFYRLPGQIQGFFKGLADIISWPFKTAFNAIKNLWNSTVGGFGFTVPSWVPGLAGKGFKIPEMAAGGIVTRPTVALLGESGREAVIPLSGSTTLGLGQATIVNLNVYALTASAEVGRKVYESLREFERVNGRSWLSSPGN